MKVILMIDEFVSCLYDFLKIELERKYQNEISQLQSSLQSSQQSLISFISS